MFEVFAISTVRSISGAPVRGSVELGELARAPRSSRCRARRSRRRRRRRRSANFARACSSTVLPVPKPPGMIALPPRATGKSRSRTRWPVTSGTSGASSRSRPGGPAHRPAVGERDGAAALEQDHRRRRRRPRRRGPRRPAPRRPAARAAGGRSRGAARGRRGGVPGRTSSPGATAGSNCHRRVAVERREPDAAAEEVALPLARGARAAAARRRRSAPRSPGPSSTESGSPVASTGSPRARPAVSSYTCTVARSPSMRMTSPRSRSCPTHTTSLSPATASPCTTTVGPAIRTSRPVAPAMLGWSTALPGRNRHGCPPPPPSFTA